MKNEVPVEKWLGPNSAVTHTFVGRREINGLWDTHAGTVTPLPASGPGPGATTSASSPPESAETGASLAGLA